MAADPIEFIPELDAFKSYKPPRLLAANLWIPESVGEYDKLYEWILSLVESGKRDQYLEMMRVYSSSDLYFMLNYLLSDGMKMHNQTGQPLYRHEVYRRYCMRTQWQLDNFVSSVDTSARSFSKSSIRTKASAIQMMIRYPEIAQAIVSVKRELAERQFGVCMEECDTNKMLKMVHEDVFHWDPREAAKGGDTSIAWSKDGGLRVKRKLPRMNNTLEQHRIVGSAPTGSRFDVSYLEDVENEEFVANAEQLRKLHESLAAFAPLLTPVAIPVSMQIMNNTLYSANGIVKKRVDSLTEKQRAETDPMRKVGYVMMYPAERGDLVNGKFIPLDEGECPGGGLPNYPFTVNNLQQIYESMDNNRVKYFTQMLGDVTGGEDVTFKRSHIVFSDTPARELARGTNCYIGIDASRGVQDPLAAWAWGAANDKRVRWIGGLRRKMDPASPYFHDSIHTFVTSMDALSNRVVEIRVEQFASQSWADLIRSELQKRGCHIPVVPCRNRVAEKTGHFRTSKMERIWQRLAPPLQRGQIIFPKSLKMGGEGMMTTNEKGHSFCLIDHFLDFEFDMFPSPKHDDLFDAATLIWDTDCLPIIYPPLVSEKSRKSTFWSRSARGGSWMSAGG